MRNVKKTSIDILTKTISQETSEGYILESQFRKRTNCFSISKKKWIPFTREIQFRWIYSQIIRRFKFWKKYNAFSLVSLCFI